MLKISIPTPCHEDWNAMIPNAQGKHCNACAKTVVDFTSMTDDEVKHFLLNRKDEKLCGRFRNEQLHRITIDLPNNIFYLHIPLWKKYLAAILIVFSTTLFSCDTHLQGEPNVKEDIQTLGGAMATINNIESLSNVDTAIIEPVSTLREITTKGALGAHPIIQVLTPTEIQGNIAIEPVPPTIDQGIIQFVDTPKIEENYNTVGKIIFMDSVSTKTKDTANCNKKIYY